MTQKQQIGRLCEFLVKEIIERKSGFHVANINDESTNYPVVDLVVTDTERTYTVSVKAKTEAVWPSVKGVQKSDQFMVFVSVHENADPDFYILTKRQWDSALKRMLPNRDAGAEIVNGAIEWNWEVSGKKKKRRGSFVKPDEINQYKNNWKVLPGIGVT